MFIAAPGDVILRALIDGAFYVLDATSLARVAGPLPLIAALAYAKERGASNIFQPALDGRGRLIPGTGPVTGGQALSSSAWIF
jgi:hypothetical protein